MRTLTFSAASFAWQSFSKTLEHVEDVTIDCRVQDAIVVFLHLEAADVDQEERVFKHALKHVKWLANKRGWRQVVLHSFTHLGADNAPPDFAEAFLRRLAERLRATDYAVDLTPFGYFCAWQLDVLGDSLAKVYKAF